MTFKTRIIDIWGRNLHYMNYQNYTSLIVTPSAISISKEVYCAFKQNSQVKTGQNGSHQRNLAVLTPGKSHS